MKISLQVAMFPFEEARSWRAAEYRASQRRFTGFVALVQPRCTGDETHPRLASMLLGIVTAGLLVWFLWRMSRQDNDVTRLAWERFADATGLVSQTFNPLLGGQTFVSGVYGSYPVELYSRTYGKGLVQATRFTVVLPGTVHGTLRLRGPFDANEAPDVVTDGLFQASESEATGRARRFYARSDPKSLVERLYRHEKLWSDLTSLDELCSIELDRQHLTFEQLGVIHDVDYLQTVIDLLARIGEEIDRDRDTGP